MRNRRRNFTLVELLVVIGIIAILAGMLMAGIMYAPAKAQKAKAQAEVTTLLNAIKQYESTYGVLPIPKDACLKSDGKTPKDDLLTDAQFDKMIAILQADTDSTAWSGLDDKDKGKNKRRTRFLDVQGNESGSFTDPWGNNYYVAFDADYDGKIKDVVIAGLNASYSDTYRYTVIIWSKGNDRKAKSDTPADKTNEDNVYSFPTTWSSSTGHNISK